MADLGPMTGGAWTPEELLELPDHVGPQSGLMGFVRPRVRRQRRAELALAPGDETWGIFGIPEAELHLLPDDLDGRDAIELGCGTGYVSAWLARRGARPVGIDNSPKQLETATRLQAEHGLDFPLLLGNAERVPYPTRRSTSRSASTAPRLWADPYAWIPEAARLLRPGGRLMFLTNGTCWRS